MTVELEDVRVSVCCGAPEHPDVEDFCSKCGEGTGFELVEQDVKVTQRMAVDAMERYGKAHKAEKTAKNEKDSISKAILKPYLEANQGETLYDGESGLEARLKPHSAPRWLSEQISDELLRWAFGKDVVKFSATKLDELAKKFPDGEAIKALQALVRPGGEGEPRLSVSRRESAE